MSDMLLPPPIIGKDLLRSVQQARHEVGIHCWDHVNLVVVPELRPHPTGQSRPILLKSRTINNQYLQHLKPGLIVHTIHAELRGNALSTTFIELLKRHAERNVRFLALAAVADEFGADAPTN